MPGTTSPQELPLTLKLNTIKKTIGQTKDAGFQFGIRRTVPLPSELVWDFLFSPAGLKLWLGKLEHGLKLAQAYQTQAGTTGRVRVFQAGSHLRLDWKPAQWTNSSILQLRVIAKGDKTTIAIHQEKLLDAAQRAAMKAHWGKVIHQLAKNLLELAKK